MAEPDPKNDLKDPDPKAPENDPENDPDDDDELGPAGVKALNAMKARARAAERDAKKAQAELAKVTAANQSEQDKAIAQAKADGKAEALATSNERLVRAEVKSAAVGKLAKPDLALKLLDLDDFAPDDDGNVDEKAITSAIDDLVKEYPELAAGAKPKPGSGGGGARPGAPAGADMNSLIRRSAGF